MGGVIDPIDREVGARLRARRLALGLKRTEVAGALEISRQQVMNYEAGVSRMPVAALVKAAARLDTSAAWLATGAAVEAAPVRFLGPDSHSAARLLRAYARLESDEARAALLVLARALARCPRQDAAKRNTG